MSENESNEKLLNEEENESNIDIKQDDNDDNISQSPRRKQAKLEDNKPPEPYNAFANSPFASMVSSKSSTGTGFGASPFASTISGASPFAAFAANASTNVFESKKDDESTDQTENKQEAPVALFSNTTQQEETAELVVVTGEEDEECIFQVRAKLYRLTMVSTKKDETKSPSEPKSGFKRPVSPEKEVESNEEKTKAGEEQKNERDEKPATPPPQSATPKKTDESITETATTASTPKESPAVQREYREMGVGTIRINLPKGQAGKGMPRMVMRREGVLKLLLNATIWKTMPVEKAGDKVLRFTCTSVDENSENTKPDTFLLKFARVEECGEFLDALQRARDY